MAINAGSDRLYAVADEELVTAAGGGGEVVITEDGDRLVGRIHLPEVDVNAEFTASWCPANADLFALVEASPAYVCPR